MDTLISVGTLAALGWSATHWSSVRPARSASRMPFEFRLVRHDGTANSISKQRSASPPSCWSAAIRSAGQAPSRGRAARPARTRRRAMWRCCGTVPSDASGSISSCVGDQFVVRPGERIATDGWVVSGPQRRGHVHGDRRVVPVEVGPGDSVVGGTGQHLWPAGGQATRMGADTQLAQIARLVEAGAGRQGAACSGWPTRSPAIFVPVVIAIAVATLGFWLGQGSGASFAFTAAVVGVDHRLSLCARAGHADRAAGRHRAGSAAGHPDQGP